MADLEKIKRNANNLIDYIDGCNNYSNSVPMEVYNAFLIPVPSDDGKQGLASILFWSAFELIGNCEFPGAGVVSWMLGGLVDYYSQDGKTPDNLNQQFAQIIQRFSETMLQMRRDMSAIYDNPEKHLNDVYTIPFGDKKTFTVSELENYSIPDKNNNTDLIDMFRKAFRKVITKQIMPNHYQIAVIYNKTTERPDPFEPEVWLCSQNPEDDNTSCEHDGSNCPYVWNTHNNGLTGTNIILVTAPGSNNNHYNDCSTDMIEFANCGSDISENSFYLTLFEMVKKYGSGSFYSNRINDGGNVEYYCYWLVNYRDCDRIYSKIQSNDDGWQVAPEAFTKWLFIDDGGKHTVNADGVAIRSEVFKQWGLDGSKGVH